MRSGRAASAVACWRRGRRGVGKAFGVERVPVIKQQAISAYDPRVVEATGVAMMSTAQGADHTAGNLPRLVTQDMPVSEIISQSLAHQTRVAAVDSLGLCVFGGSVTLCQPGLPGRCDQRRPRDRSRRGLFRAVGPGARWSRSTSSTVARDSKPATTNCRRSFTRSRCRRRAAWRASVGADVHDMYDGLPAVGGEGA